MAMSWIPKYTITPKLLSVIRQIGEEIGLIRSVRLPTSARQELQAQARQISTHASTSIEGNPLALTDVRRLLKNNPKQVRDTEKEILNYNNALGKIYHKVHNKDFVLKQSVIKQIQGDVTSGLLENPKYIGQLRTEPVVIRDPRSAELILFIPPDAKDVPRLLKELINFTNDNLTELDGIILAGLFHRQNVIIHPFMDGNGRTTRIITTAILGMSGLEIFDLFSFENFYNRNVSRYFKVVGAFGDYYEEKDALDHTQWLEYFAEGILDELIRVRGQLRRTKSKLEPHHQLILDHIDQNGSITQREYGEVSTRSLAARKNDFNDLLNWKLIERSGAGRSVTYTAVE